MSRQTLSFADYIDGDCVNERDGVKTERGILLSFRLCAPEGHDVYLCGEKAVFADGFYTANRELTDYETALTAEDETTGESASVTLYYLRHAVKKYRVSSDDNILFLADLNARRDEYGSIFENPYLAVYKKAHDLYGAKVHLNLFYEFNEESAVRFSEDRPLFDLSQMTDRFREEFEKNSDWLRLSFHAKSEYPASPYRDAPVEEVVSDCSDVHREILRFAGKPSLAEETTVHYGNLKSESLSGLKTLGYRAFAGYFTLNASGIPSVSYLLPKETVEHIGERDFFYSRPDGTYFGKVDLVLNLSTQEQNLAALEEIMKNPTRGGFVSMLMHEQYFYPDYRHYLPDFERRILEPCRILFENGYEGAFFSEAIRP